MILRLYTVAIIATFFKKFKCDIVVETEEGAVNGIALSSKCGSSYLGFRGIPYAEPPVGELRFKDPVAKAAWSGVRDATGHTCECPQYAGYLRGDEDCLYLTVHTPQLKPKEPYPVIVHIHPGGNMVYSGSVLFGEDYFMLHEVVFVTMEFRLGPFGFLSLADEVIPGNMGLKDQVMALKWVQRNIEHFGGDPNRVTLFGLSSGAQDVHMHMYSPLSKNLFQQGISMSSTALYPPTFSTPASAKEVAIKIAELLNCPTGNTTEILYCLQSKPAKQFSVLTTLYTGWSDVKIMSINSPVVDDYATNPFLPRNMHTSEPYPKPWFTGCVDMEGYRHAIYLISNENEFDVMDASFDYFAPTLLSYNGAAKNTAEVTSQIRKFYFGDGPITPDKLQAVIDLYSDAFFLWPLEKSLRLHRGTKYLYRNSFYNNTSCQLHSGLKISAHGEEMYYIFCMNTSLALEEIPEEFTDTELEFSNNMIKLIVNFATYGNPTQVGFDFEWPLYDETRQQLRITNDGFEITENPLTDRLKFWSQLPYRNKID